MSDEVDRYLWLEEVTGEAALEWVRERNAPTVEELTGGERFADLEAGALEVLDTDDRIPLVRRRGDYLYNFWRDATHVRGLWRRTTLESYRTDSPEWDVLLDVDALARAEDENWVYAGVTMLEPDHTRALVSLSRGGADATVIREFDVTSRDWVADGFVLEENKSSMGWIDADTVYVGTEFPDLPADEPSFTDSGYPRVVRRWRRGQSLAEAETVFAGETGDVAVRGMFDSTPGYPRHFVSRATDFYNSLTYELRDGEPILIDVPTDARPVVHHDRLFVLNRSTWQVGGGEYEPGTLLVFDYADYLAGGRDHEVLFAPDERTSLADFTFTASHLVLVTLQDVQTRIGLRRLGDWTASAVAGLPEPATVTVLDTDPDHSDEMWVSVSSFTTPPSLYHGDSGSELSVIKRSPAFFDADGITSEQRFTVSDDGTRIPYFVIKGPGDGPAPTLLYGYGGFENAMTPGYLAIAGRSWLTRGGTYVIANIRGGGEYGPTWHTQTQKAGRHKVYEDFAAVARALVADGLTTVEQLAAQGGSNGGLLMGVMLTRYPELFGALVCQVPLLDMRRYHLLLAGASWMAEYGDPDDPEQWEFMQPFSPYQNLTGEADYPQILITTSTRDDRVHPGHARKFAARLAEYGHSVRYYENIEGGHGGAADNKQAAFKSALAYEFLWRTVGAV